MKKNKGREKLIQWREETGTYQQAADKLGVVKEYIYAWCTTDRMPSAYNLLLIKNCTDIPMEDWV